MAPSNEAMEDGNIRGGIDRRRRRLEGGWSYLSVFDVTLNVTLNTICLLLVSRLNSTNTHPTL